MVKELQACLIVLTVEWVINNAGVKYFLALFQCEYHLWVRPTPGINVGHSVAEFYLYWLFGGAGIVKYSYIITSIWLCDKEWRLDYGSSQIS